MGLRHVLGGAMCALALAGAPAAAADVGSFTSSDPQLNAIWAGSVRTAQDMLAPGPLATDSIGRDCTIGVPVVLLDGVVRDRCPYVGDEAVIDRTLDVSTPYWDVQRSMLAWFAEHQHPDGAIPASPLAHGSLVLFDYNAYWLQALHDYVLYSGDVAFAREVWPNVTRLLDDFYVTHQSSRGLLVNDLGPRDYAYIRRNGDVVAYYNAQAVYAMREAVELAGWVGDSAAARRWDARAAAIAAAFADSFWDEEAGAFFDTTLDRATHPQDGNAFAVLSGIATGEQASSALEYLWAHTRRDYGDTIVDRNTWDAPGWGMLSGERVYPFMSYYEVSARFMVDDDLSALDQLRRTWGYMLRFGPGTMWETIGGYGGGPTDVSPSWDAGWSSGAAPALTRYVLGVLPTSPGFETFTVDPHVGALDFASGDVPTPHGPIHVSWLAGDASVSIAVEAPPGTRWTNPPRRTRLDVAGT